ncbi:MAG: MFS transporter [Bacillota bacterium]|jgi:MFS family permease
MTPPKEVPERLHIVCLISLFLVNFGYMSDMVIVPAIGTIYGHFAGKAPMGILNLILSGAQLVAVVSAYAAGPLMRYFRKRNLLILMFAFFGLFSFAGGFFDNPYWIALTRILVGLASGGLCSVAMALIGEVYYADDHTYNRLTGYFDSTMTFIGAAMSLASGFVASAFGWQHIFYIYLLSIPILILLIFTLPKTPPENKRSWGTKLADTSKNRWLSRSVVANCASFFFVNISFCLFSFSIHVYLLETGLGDSSFAGALTACGNSVAVIDGIIFGLLYRKFSRKLPIYFYFCLSLCFILASFNVNKAWLTTAMIFGAMGYGTAIPYYYVAVKKAVERPYVSRAMALTTATMGLGAAMSSFAMTFLRFIGFPSMISIFPCYAAVAVIGCLMAILLSRKAARAESIGKQ